MSLPTKAKVVIIGGGIHGLSTAWKLSETYKNPGDIVVLEKKDTAAGASGIACGVVRNNYFQPAMRELMAHSVSVWESDPKAFKYNPVGYMQISPEVMHKDVASIYEQQKAIGYEAEFIEGEKDCMKYMKGIFDDWQAEGITSVLHEKKDTAAGASGIACGVVRNNYFQPAMRELMALSVSVWESDPKAFKYNPVGYLQISPEIMHEDVASIYDQQKAIGYESDFIEG